MRGDYHRNCSFHTKESLLGIFIVVPVVLPGPCGFAKQPHGHRRGSRTGGDADGKVVLRVRGTERSLCGRGRHFFDVEISVGVRGSAHVACVGGGTAHIPSLDAGEAFLGQSRRVFGELVRTEWVGDVGAPVVGQEGLGVL